MSSFGAAFSFLCLAFCIFFFIFSVHTLQDCEREMFFYEAQRADFNNAPV